MPSVLLVSSHRDAEEMSENLLFIERCVRTETR